VADRRFDRFVMFAGMRTGSNFLEANLNALPGVTCHGEVFNPHFIGRKDQMEMMGITIAQRDRDPLKLLARLAERTEGLSGFRFFHDHDPRVLAAVLPDPRCAKIVLTRNPVDSYVSWKIAQETGQWKLTDAKNLRTARVRFDAAEFAAHLERLQAFQMTLLSGLQTTGQTAFYLDYDDIQDVAVLNGLAAFLGVEARLDAPDGTLKKQNPDELADKVQNPEEMAAALAALDRFDLGRTPNFEPRRGAAIPSFVAAGDAPLLFLPVRGGPEDDILRWMDGIGAGGLMRDFTQKDLRQWKRARPGHRSFAVVRHPLARAHAVFAGRLLAGRMADVRQAMARMLKVDLPPTPDAGAHRAGFLAFLRLAKMALAGQTALRLDAHLATQTAVLQGFAQLQCPDVVLREDRLVAGLDWIAREAGVTAPPFVASPAPGADLLAALYDAEIEAAAREAYQRDYIGFGFADWRPDGA
jgi:LPS sulfotransferase NodH